MHWTLFSILLPATLFAAPALDYAVSADLSALVSPKYAVDRQGNIVVVGNARSCALPVVRQLSACGSVWIGKLDPTGHTLVFATYLGTDTPGGPLVAIGGVATDRDGNIVLAASTSQSTLPVLNAIQPSVRGRWNLYLAKLAADGSRLLYGTYLGGGGDDNAQALAVDEAGAAYVMAYSNSTGFPTTAQSLHSTSYGTTVVAKLSADGRSLVYGASFPYEYSLHGINVDRSGAAMLMTRGAIFKLAPDGSALQKIALPQWALGNYPWMTQIGAGGFMLSGSVFNGTLPVTARALQSVSGPSPYMRIENGVATRTQVPAHVIRSLVVDPRDRSFLYAATDSGLFESADNGLTWILLKSASASSIAVDPFRGTLYLATDSTSEPDRAVYRSTDSGETWTPAVNGINDTRIFSIAADSHVPGLVYAVGSTLYRSEDRGETWQAAGQLAPPVPGGTPTSTYTTKPTDIRIDPSHAGRAYLLGMSSCIGFCPVGFGLFRTDDGGKTAANVLPGLQAVKDFAVDPTTGDLFVLADGYLTVFRQASLDTPEVVTTTKAIAIALDSQHPGTIYLSLDDGAIIRSDNGGGHWGTVVHLPTQASRLAVGAGGVLHASQVSDAEDAYAFWADRVGNVLYGTYFGSGSTHVNTAAAIGDGHLWLAGSTGAGLPVAKAFQPQSAGGTDGFVAEFEWNGTLISATYLGGLGTDQIDFAAPLEDGSVVVAGTTESADFPSLQPSPLGAGKTFFARLRPL